MRTAWNKGLNKHSNSSVMKIAETMRKNKIDNFRTWRDEMRLIGKFPKYKTFTRNGDLAELIGVILGDGNITKFARTEGLRIVGTWSNRGFAKRYAELIKKVFGKEPSVKKRSKSNAVNITIYQCKMSERLGIPTGAKGNLKDVLPEWVEKSDELVIRYLRGLYEAEGSHCVHEPTYTYKLLFSNKNKALLDAVFKLVKRLGYHPHRSQNQIQISRKQEVLNFKNLLKFRNYE